MTSPFTETTEAWTRMNEEGFKVVESLTRFKSDPEVGEAAMEVLTDFGEEFMQILEGYVLLQTIHNMLQGATQERIVKSISVTSDSVLKRLKIALGQE